MGAPYIPSLAVQSGHGDVLDLDEIIDAVMAALAAEAGFLDAAEGGDLV